jgi:uncharacterized membrane protein YheB (UPF0754 family)
VTDWLWTLPLVGGAIGYATNWLAVRMLFRPRRPVRVFGITFLGLLPRRRAELARSVAETVERELVRPEDIQRFLADPGLRAAAEAEIDRRVCDFLARKFDQLPTIALVLLPADLELRLRRSIVKHVLETIPDLASKLGDDLRKRIEIRRLVEERINRFEVERLEEIVLEVARRELRAIELLGAVIGAAVGGAEWALLSLLAA